MQIITLNEKDFTEFASNNKYRSYYQTTNYGNLSRDLGYETYYLGFLNNNSELVGATLLLVKTILGKYKYGYAPRGFLMDYNNQDFVNDLSIKLRELLMKQNFIFIKIDPLITCTERDKKGKILSSNTNINKYIEILTNAGFVHKGFNNNFETLKPRWNAVLRLNKRGSALYDEFSKDTRYKLRDAAKYGLKVLKGTKKDFDTFYNLVKDSPVKEKEYYEAYIRNFKEDFEYFLVYLDPSVTVVEVKNEYEEELRQNDEYNMTIASSYGKADPALVNKKMESDKRLSSLKQKLVESTNILKEYPYGIAIAACAIVKYDNGITFLVDGYDKRFSSYNANYLCKWGVILTNSKKDYNYINLNGISGEFSEDGTYKGLNDAKLGFNATAIEFIGEFDFVINESMYKQLSNEKVQDQIVGSM